jgi:hypothetical protein
MVTQVILIRFMIQFQQQQSGNMCLCSHEHHSKSMARKRVAIDLETSKTFHAGNDCYYMGITRPHCHDKMDQSKTVETT